MMYLDLEDFERQFSFPEPRFWSVGWNTCYKVLESGDHLDEDLAENIMEGFGEAVRIFLDHESSSLYTRKGENREGLPVYEFSDASLRGVEGTDDIGGYNSFYSRLEYTEQGTPEVKARFSVEDDRKRGELGGAFEYLLDNVQRSKV